MINEKFVVKYGGMDADKHRLPAYEAGVSIQGIARSVTLVTTYLATGKIRKNAPFESDIAVYLRPLRAGSLDTVYQLISNHTPEITVGAIAVGVTSNLIYDTMKLVFKRVTGQPAKPTTEELKLLERERPGDISALEDAVEPALVQAHRIIGSGSNNIVIFGNNNRIIFDKKTRDYVNADEVEPKVKVKEVSIGSFNANQKTGRLFDAELGKTVPFSIESTATQRTSVAIASSLREYAAKGNSNVEISYRQLVAPDGHAKRYLIQKASRRK